MTVEKSPEKQTVTINFGPQHPSTHGVLYLVVELDGERIVGVEPKIGYLYRSIEKMIEFRSYNHVIPFLDRCDYITALSTELAYVLAVEQLMQIEPPERAQYIRTIMVELSRIISHIFFYGAYGMDLGALTPLLYAFRDREIGLDLIEMVTGYRLTPNYMRIGGVKFDLPDGFLEKLDNYLNVLPKYLKEYDDLLTGNEIFLNRTKNVGIMAKEWAINIGITGPLLRGTGYKWDIRKDDPYLIYDNFDFDIPTGENGDCYSAYQVRLKEIRESMKIIRQAMSKLPDGKYRHSQPVVIRPPKGESWFRVESPRGELGIYIVSDGTERPYRMKIRAPSFVNLQAIPDMFRGQYIADTIAILGALDPVMGEVDR